MQLGALMICWVVHLLKPSRCSARAHRNTHEHSPLYTHTIHTVSATREGAWRRSVREQKYINPVLKGPLDFVSFVGCFFVRKSSPQWVSVTVEIRDSFVACLALVVSRPVVCSSAHTDSASSRRFGLPAATWFPSHPPGVEAL